MPDIESEKLTTYRVDNAKIVARQPEVFTAFTLMIESTRPKPMSDREASMLRAAMIRDKVFPGELYQAFWAAWKDPYLPASGIEWRHLWKHIEQDRYGRDRQLYSYREMLNICSKEHITTDHFERNGELFDQLKQEHPRAEPASFQVWKRK